MRERPLDTIERFPMSWEEYLELPEDLGAEWVDGEVVVSPRPAARHALALIGLGSILRSQLTDLHVLGEGGLRMSHSLRGPDVMVVERMPDGPWVTEPPVLAAEILSPSTQSEDLVRKSTEYVRAGVGQYWVVDPEARTIEVFENAGATWEPLARLDGDHPTAEVAVAGHGVVSVDLAAVLDG
jgi:Uma2 family endonuclease